MIFAIVSVAAALLLIIALNWDRFQALGRGHLIRLALIWAVIIIAMVLALRLLGVG